MPQFSFGKPGEKAVESAQQSPPMKVGDMATSDSGEQVTQIGSTGPATLTGSETRLPIHMNPNVAPKVDATSDAGVQGIGPSAISSGLPGLEPKAPTGNPAITDNLMLQLTAEEKEFILKRRKNAGFVDTADIPMGNPRLAGGSDVFSTQSDKQHFRPTVSLEASAVKPTGLFPKLAATSDQESPDFIPNAEPFVGQRRAAGEHKFKVQLVNQPAEFVFAQDRLEAQYRYAKRLGINSTIHPYTVEQVD